MYTTVSYSCFYYIIMIIDIFFYFAVEDSCSLFPSLKCSFGCRGKHQNEGFCFCETGYKLADDQSTCIGKKKPIGFCS